MGLMRFWGEFFFFGGGGGREEEEEEEERTRQTAWGCIRKIANWKQAIKGGSRRGKVQRVTEVSSWVQRVQRVRSNNIIHNTDHQVW